MSGNPPIVLPGSRVKCFDPPPVDNDIVSEHSIAHAFIEEHGEGLKFCEQIGGWFRWDGNRWKPDHLFETFQDIRFFTQKNTENQPPSRRVTFGKTSTLRGIEVQARTAQGVIQREDWFDGELMLLGTPGGIVDLTTGTLRPGQMDDRITKSAVVTPKNGPCPTFLKFIKEATQGDDALIRLLQQWFGYCLTGQTIEHALMFFYGPGGNGKGLLLNFVTWLLGDYGAAADMKTFTASKHERHSSELASLIGKRTVTAPETEEGQAWAESRIKQLTGGDPIKANFMRQDPITFIPQFKLMISGNHKPVLRNVDDAMRRRLMIIPFTFIPPVKDIHLDEKLKAEAPAILHWMIEGCLDWQQNGLVKPDSVIAATAEYFEDQDVFQHWLDEDCDCEPGNEHKWETATDLFSKWSTFAKSRGDDPGSSRSFKDLMLRHGFTNKRTKTGARYLGIRIRQQGSFHGED